MSERWRQGREGDTPPFDEPSWILTEDGMPVMCITVNGYYEEFEDAVLELAERVARLPEVEADRDRLKDEAFRLYERLRSLLSVAELPSTAVFDDLEFVIRRLKNATKGFGLAALGPFRAELDYATGNMPWSVYGKSDHRLASFQYEEDAVAFADASNGGATA